MSLSCYGVLVLLVGVCGMSSSNVDQENTAVDATRLRRHSGLCPSGMSRETCFYSQLNMLMKIHDSMMDPVSLRNIGKRNGGPNLGAEPSPNDVMAESPLTSYFLSNGKRPTQQESALTPNVASFEDIDFDKRSAADFTKDARLLKLIKTMNKLDEGDRYHIMKLLDGSSEQIPDISQSRGEWREPNAEIKRGLPLSLPSQAKRHIICPASMSRIECYDQALAFYMRLMRSVGKQ